MNTAKVGNIKCLTVNKICREYLLNNRDGATIGVFIEKGCVSVLF